MAKESQSQLKRLKSALRDSGISRDPKAKGPRKSRVDRQKELSRIREKFNPYETQINKSKFAVGGRKIKGTEGRPGAAASIAEKMRQDTIGQERARKGRVGGVLDRRFGEGRADLTPEQIQLERYTRERQKGKKRNNFSLEDDEGLTHLGQSLSAMDDFGPAPMSDDEDMGAEMVSRTNFGGFEDQQLEEDEIIGEDGEKRKKTKAEIMQEIIAKSKQGRSDRQRQAEEDDDAREALDAELEDLQMLLSTTQEKKPTAQDGLSSDRMKALQEDTEYDKAVKSLIFDRRAKASERTKTEEELIEEEAKRLHEQEEARIKRMRGEEPDEDDSRNKKRKRSAQGDDLSDDFQSESGSDVESVEGDFGVGVNAAAAAQVEIDSEDGESDAASDEEDDQNGDATQNATIEVRDSEGEDDYVEEMIDEDDDDQEVGDSEGESDEGDLPSAELVAAAQAELARREATGSTSKNQPQGILKRSTPAAVTVDPSELKFTYPCPSSLQHLLDIVTPLSIADIPTALHRIRVLHHPRLNPENNLKLSKYLTILIDYVLSDETPRTVADYCVTQIHELSQKYWEPSTTHFLEILEDTRQAMYKKMDTRWTIRQLKFFGLVGQVWSTSDAYHKVVTPSFLVVAQYLAQNSDSSEEAKGIKLALCVIVAHWMRDSKRYMPELVQCLLRLVTTTRSTDSGTLEPFDVCNPSGNTETTLHNAAERLVLQLGTLYLSNPAFVDIFTPFLPHLSTPHSRDALVKALSNATQSRRPLSLQSHRPIPLASYVPKFEENFSLDKKSYDRNADRSADAKLKAEMRDAKRGAVRVLRRDAAFEAREGARERRGRDETYRAKIKKAENRIRQVDD